MRLSPLLFLVVAGLGACRRVDARPSREGGDAQVVAVAVRTEPPGAQVRINRLRKTWTTPCDIADFSLGKGVIDVEVSLAGYQTVTTKAKYDGYDPVILQMTLIPEAPPPAAATPAVVAPVLVAPLAVAPAAAPPAPPSAPLPTAKLEAVAGGTRLRVNSGSSRIRIQTRVVVADPEKPSEYFLPNVPPDRVIVEFLDPKTDAVLQSVEFAPPAAPAPGVKGPEPKETPAPEAARVGEVKVVSKTFGVYVKLDPGLALQPGEEILIYRDGREVARSKILKITPGDPAYPDGAAQVQKDGSIQKGDEVRRQKP
ncbi:MAG TPA: PEGA domain-containing protein [Planctomycetota bacterium]|nr:PEGA domain-containing protein [Planctomycetota bacterium]